MTRFPLALAAPLAAVALLAGATRAYNPEHAAIEQTIQHYFDGGTSVRKAFNPEARMLYVKDGQLAVVPIADYIAKVEASAGKKSDYEMQKRIASVDVSGNAAVAKLELKGKDVTITDYMSLLKVDGQWVIVNKIFDKQAAARTAASR